MVKHYKERSFSIELKYNLQTKCIEPQLNYLLISFASGWGNYSKFLPPLVNHVNTFVSRIVLPHFLEQQLGAINPFVFSQWQRLCRQRALQNEFMWVVIWLKACNRRNTTSIRPICTISLLIVFCIYFA